AAGLQAAAEDVVEALDSRAGNGNAFCPHCRFLCRLSGAAPRQSRAPRGPSLPAKVAWIPAARQRCRVGALARALPERSYHGRLGSDPLFATLPDFTNGRVSVLTVPGGWALTPRRFSAASVRS